MKTKFICFMMLTASILSFVSCSKDDDNPVPVNETKESYIDATSKTMWTYFSLKENKIVGTGEENESDNAAWAARKDWDIAICRYNVRTNSGKATHVGAQGGVYTCNASISFSSLSSVPEGATFMTDEIVTSKGMGGITSIVKSTATVITFQMKEDGSLVMPPVYQKSPIYIFRSADGQHGYKVSFTQYLNEEKVAGHVKFYSSQLF